MLYSIRLLMRNKGNQNEITKIKFFIQLQYYLPLFAIIKMQIQLPKPMKNLIKPYKSTKISHERNIFLDDLQKNTIQQMKSVYDVVGDPQFKTKFFSVKKSKMSETISQFKSVQDTNLNSTYCFHTRSIENGDLTRNLSKQKQLQITRHARTFLQFSNNRLKQQKIKNHLKQRMSYFGTRDVPDVYTYQKKQIYSHPNPQLLELINDNVPQYWKNSLRDNQKRLKRHLKGNTFKKQIAEEMMQTLKGRKTLISSIPKIKDQYIQPVCSKSIANYSRRGFSLKGGKGAKSEFSKRIKLGLDQKQVPLMVCEQVYKTAYDGANKWKVSEFS